MSSVSDTKSPHFSIGVFCVSPSQNDEHLRCQNVVIGKSQFCKIHSDKHKPLYMKHKKLEKHLPEDIPGGANTKYLLRIYAGYVEAYQLRDTYRKQAFMPETWDRGHDLRISFIWGKIEEITQILEDRFDPGVPVEALIVKNTTFSLSRGEIEDKIDLTKLTSTLEKGDNEKKISKLKQIQNIIRKKETEFDTLVSQYIKDRNLKRQQRIEDYNEYDQDLQKKILKVKYIKDFILFVNFFMGFVISSRTLTKLGKAFKNKEHLYEVMKILLKYDNFNFRELSNVYKNKIYDTRENKRIKTYTKAFDVYTETGVETDEETEVEKNFRFEAMKQLHSIYTRLAEKSLLSNINYIIEGMSGVAGEPASRGVGKSTTSSRGVVIKNPHALKKQNIKEEFFRITYSDLDNDNSILAIIKYDAGLKWVSFLQDVCASGCKHPICIRNRLIIDHDLIYKDESFCLSTTVLPHPGRYSITNNYITFSDAIVMGSDVDGRKYLYSIQVPDDTITACNVIVRELIKRKNSDIKWHYIT